MRERAQTIAKRRKSHRDTYVHFDHEERQALAVFGERLSNYIESNDRVVSATREEIAELRRQNFTFAISIITLAVGLVGELVVLILS